MNFNQYSSIQKKNIDIYLHDYISQFKELTTNKLLFATSVLDQIDEFVVRGKSIRGILTILSAEMFNNKNDNSHLEAAGAIELIHSSLLIHDDIMDNDVLRRGKPSIFSQYIPLAKEHGINSPYFSQSMGISVGNCALLLGVQLLNKLRNYELTNYILQEIAKTNIAQMNDVFVGEKNNIASEEEIMEIYRYKTARYTFSLPLVVGAMLTKKGEEIKENLSDIGEYIGILFQLQDDNIGLYSNLIQAGKQIGSDIINNKKTLLRFYLKQSVSEKERKELDAIYGNKNLNKEQILIVQSLCKKYFIDKQIEKKKNELKISAEKIIDTLTIKKIYKQLLLELVDFVFSRSK